ncbi:AraC family transcriptional regulator [Nocardioides sp. HDW12B]|uniref:AraC family transcriptional regulator n=1 Tax=Nocardioides sp. HDW12B TaxID=2714939 RepID=UPI0014086300|nr:AraC family transcriptional regulator [Nocardioides sp. HDW12B]QIK65953.1 AraC family transcriptional regulator [Nocardioides sp. HDW12B]
MPTQEYLTDDVVMSTRSLEEARDAVTRVYLPHELVGEHDAIDMRLNAVSDRFLTLGYLTYQADTELRMPAAEQWYHVNLQLTGATWAHRSDGTREHTPARTRGLVLNPSQRNTVRWSPDAEQLILKVPRSGLESHLADLIGRPVTEAVDFDFGLDLSTAPGMTLLRSVELLATELERPGGLRDMPLARAQLESYVLTALLHAGRHQYTDALAGREDGARLGRLAPVVRYIEEHADAELTPELLARVACVSVRTLHAAFSEQLGESPMAYVRRIRLGKVRADLLRADPQRERVTDIALRWGFFHQSRFAQQYREQFHELPSATLQR